MDTRWGSGRFLQRGTRRRLLLRAAAAGAACVAAVPLRAAAKAALVLGHTCPLSGVFAGTAAEMTAAIEAATAEANAAGGIGGRQLKLVSLDDGYDPQRSLANAQQLRRQAGAVALVAPIGTANLAQLMPWAAETQTPLIGARSGAEAQREYHRWTFFNMASFSDEVAFTLRHLQTIHTKRVAVLYMANPAGNEIWQRFASSTRAHGLTIVRAESFGVDGKRAAQAAQPVVAQAPDAVLLAGGGAGAVEVARQLLAAGQPAGRVYALSMLQAAQIHAEIGESTDGMVFCTVMPAPGNPKLGLCQAYRRALERVGSGGKGTSFGLEGYLSMRIAIRALQSAADPADGLAIVDALERMNHVDMDGMHISYDHSQHRGTRFVELAILSGGQLRR